MKKKIIFIVGPTSVGKTKLSVDIAKEFSGEIISCDSMQIYKEFNIGTAKITEEEVRGINHYMIDILDGNQKFNVSEYKKMAENYIEEIYSHNSLPIFVGGTGLYLNSMLYDFKFTESEEPNNLREQITEFYEKNGANLLYDLLLYLDYSSREKIHKNNIKRVIRAIEVCLNTGKEFSKQCKDYENNNDKYDYLIIGLTLDRKILYDKINSRVDIMINNGLVEEASSLYKKYGEYSQPFTAIGYKEFIPYFKREITLESCIDNIKQNSRKYAKRQFTWFNRNEDIHWIDVENGYDEVLLKSKKLVKDFLTEGEL
ncbi:tRNA (adenosine(37)-N6)-dimethylallyltransferase MiaA [Parvimonas micra]